MHFLQKNRAELIFYCLLFAGTAIFADLFVALLQTVALFLSNTIFKKLLKIKHPGFQTIFSLACFWIFYLPAAGIFQTGYKLPLSVVLILTGGSAFFIKSTKDPSSGEIYPGRIFFAFALVACLTIAPFFNVGKKIASGFAYRAYFSSDYLKHYAVCHQLNNGQIPPSNPYFTGRVWNYYWFSYTFPSYIASFNGDVEKATKGWSFAVNFTFLLVLLRLLETFKLKPVLIYWGTLFPFLLSLEGLLLFKKLGAAVITRYKDFNIDALTRWWYNLPEINTLYRSLLYTPQHLLSLALIVIFFILWVKKEKTWLTGALLAISLLNSFFLGAVLIAFILSVECISSGTKVLKKELSPSETIFSWGKLFLPSLFAVLLIVMLGMNSGISGNFIYFQLVSPAATLLLLFLNFGLPLTFALLAIFYCKKKDLLIIKAGLIFSILLIIFLRWRGFENDFSLKIGLLSALFIIILSTALLEKLPTLFIVLFASLILISGAPTLIIDLANSSDINNSRFTSIITFDEKRALNFLNRTFLTPQTVALLAAERSQFFSLIPSFTRHRLFLGDPMHARIFQVPQDLYQQRKDLLEREFSFLPQSAATLYGKGIDLLWWSEYEKNFFQFIPSELNLLMKTPTIRIYQLQ